MPVAPRFPLRSRALPLLACAAFAAGLLASAGARAQAMSSGASLQGVTMLERSSQPVASVGAAAARQAWERLPPEGREACPSSPQADLSFREEPPLRVNDSLGEKQLIAMTSQRAPLAAVGEASIELGFYDAIHRVDISSPLLIVTAPQGYAVCVLKFGASVTANAQIYVARELPAGSCSRREILEHELGHYNIDRRQIEILRQETPQLASRFASVFWGATPEAARSAALAANQQLSDALQARLAQLRGAPQRDHDSAQEYERLTRSCGGETQRLGSLAARGP